MSLARGYKGIFLAGLLALSAGICGAPHALATHTECDDSDGDTTDDVQNTSTVPGVGTIFVGADYVGGGSLSGLGGWRGVCARLTDPTGSVTYRSVFVDMSDPTGAGPGVQVRVITCTTPACTATPPVVDETGAEVGEPTACNSSTGGTCLEGTTVEVDAVRPVFLGGRTGIDDNITTPTIMQGTTNTQNIACIGSTCLRSIKASAGRVDVYVDDPNGSPTASQPVCAAVGPGFSC